MCSRYNEEYVGDLKEHCRAYLTHMWPIRDNHSDSAIPSATGYSGRDSRVDRALKVLAISHAVLSGSRFNPFALHATTIPEPDKQKRPPHRASIAPIAWVARWHAGGTRA